MKKIAAKAPLLLAGVAVLLLAWGFAGASNGGDEPAGWRERGLSAPPGAIVHDAAEERPPADYPFSDPNQYWPLIIFTDSQAVRQLVISQALPGPPYGSVYFGALVPEPLVPVLEQHPEIYRLAWNGDERPDPGRTIPDNRAVTTLGSGRPLEGYPFSDPKHYRGVYVFTKSRAVRELVASRALPMSQVYADMVYGGTLHALSQSGFAAWVPDPLIPVLEAHPEVERLEWDHSKMPLYRLG